jgi:hypothetical protein
METAMSELLNTSSLFQTSLRRWQAEFKAHRSAADVPAAHAAAARRLIGASASRRVGRIKPKRAAGLIPAL